jgi:hypothetical protein
LPRFPPIAAGEGLGGDERNEGKMSRSRSV